MEVPALRVDPKPLFGLSPYLYMQFMEPLGTTDGSVEAGWDFLGDCWREDLVDATRELAPGMIRWGGCFSSYYRWKEGVGPRSRRRPMLNLLWGGMESNQVGTHEFIDFCRQVRAEPLLAVNFESDGRSAWAHPPRGGVRTAGPREAVEWVAYCNDPGNRRRRLHGMAEPYGVRFWQIGNETSYDPNGYDCETAARRTLAFARAMRRADPEIELIGWGDSGWARRMMEVAGEHLQLLAFHPHFGSGLKDSPLNGIDYRRDPERTWEHLMHACHVIDTRLKEIREETAGLGAGIALTESHFWLGGRNRGEVLSSWAAGVANARILNVHARHGDMLRIATLADFCGTRWMNNAVIIPTPRHAGTAYMMPVGRVMSLFGRHSGNRALRVESSPGDLDVTASRRGNRVFLHVVNTRRRRSIQARLEVEGRRVRSGKVFQIAADPEIEVMETCAERLKPEEWNLPGDGTWRFPAASVIAVELVIE